MSSIIIRTSYENGTAYGDRTGQVFGTSYDTTNWVFDTDAKAVTTEFAGQYDDFQDSNHPEEYNYPGEFYHYCDGTTRRGYTGDGKGGFTVAEESDSPSCGYSPPAALTCDLGSASVSQVATATGATLTAKLTGTANGQVQYRLDGGTEQSGSIFYDVAPGAHVVSLRDDGLSGCTRTVQVTVAAPPPPAAPLGPSQGLDLVGQPLWYLVPNVPAGADVALELWAESAHGAEDFALVVTLRKRPNVAGKVSFRLDTLLWPLLRAFVPPTAGPLATQLCTTNLCNYYVRTTRTLAGQAPVVATSPVRTALRGGLPPEWPSPDYAAFRATFDYAPFLSWQPTGAGTYASGTAKAVTYQQPEWLFWLVPPAATSEALCVRRRYDQPAGTVVTDTETLSRPAARGWAYRLLAIPLAPTRPGYAYLSVQVETAAGAPRSPLAYFGFVEASERTRYLLFTNSLGGLDTLRGEGRLEATLEATTDKVERPARPGDGPATPDRWVSEVSASRKLKLATGWLSPAELDWLQELVLTRELWQQVGTQLRPLDWPKRSLATYGDEPGLRGLLL